MHQVLHLRCVLVRVCEWALWVCNVGCEPCTGQMASLQTWSDPLPLRCTSSCSPRVPHSHTRPPPHARRNECMSSGWVTSAANTHLLDHLRNKPGLHVSEQPSFIPSHLREEGLYAQGAHTAPRACILPVCGSSKQARVAVSFVALREGSPHKGRSLAERRAHRCPCREPMPCFLCQHAGTTCHQKDAQAPPAQRACPQATIWLTWTWRI